MQLLVLPCPSRGVEIISRGVSSHRIDCIGTQAILFEIASNVGLPVLFHLSVPVQALN